MSLPYKSNNSASLDNNSEFDNVSHHLLHYFTVQMVRNGNSGKAFPWKKKGIDGNLKEITLKNYNTTKRKDAQNTL